MKFVLKKKSYLACHYIDNDITLKARRDMSLSERVYKVGSIFLQNGDIHVTVKTKSS